MFNEAPRTLVAASSSILRPPRSMSFPQGAPALVLTLPNQFLADKKTDVVAVVRVKATESRWVIIEHGDGRH
jgi:hypothetical protein